MQSCGQSQGQIRLFVSQHRDGWLPPDASQESTGRRPQRYFDFVARSGDELGHIEGQLNEMFGGKRADPIFVSTSSNDFPLQESC